MKTLHLTHTDIESDSRILKEMGALAAAGYAVSGLGVALDEGAQKTAISFPADIVALNLGARKLTSVPRTLRHVITLLELVFKMLPRAVRKRPDVIHCHDILVLPLGCIVKWLVGGTLVYDAHELESNRNGLTKLQGTLTLRMEKLLWRFVDALIVVSPSIDRWYQETLGPKPSAVILNSPLFSGEQAHDEDYLRKKFSIPDESKIFIYVGILGHGRGIDLLTEAFKDPQVSSHVVFLGYGELSDELKRLAAQHSNMHVHDAVPHSQVVPIAQSADFGLCLVQDVSLSDYYCLPNKLFEYCFAGVPVLASDFPDIRTVLATYGLGECCKLQANEIRDAILRLQRSQVAFQFSDLTPLSWQAQEQKLVVLYQQSLSNRNH
ncbi:glycosyltransferase [Pseudomonas mosselii]|uniref:Glycosyltransferase n=1 Tax=Pseudomonas mosselii TaxID=78327 RepID=A0ABX9B9B3_9PSED|nr:glycosyltransferase [Pseudomonas mosselii]MBH3309812.1 glycosyltransferase [Pseudomonas mosselii]MBH3325865.1 glycosyltransferase [Pseudomonas mosselii]MCL8299219.1 glycosyltransferase [Pseudomonas mosselii]MCL8338215.1 glycosyltransferase [Pseudomonas mosselii]MCU9530416.1 glycosyltransferase [Pseudomonas mosselii]